MTQATTPEDRSNRVRFAELTWFDVENRLERDCRIVVPLGATEQHGYLSLATDTVFAERVVHDAAKQASVLVAPALPFGASAFTINYPGTISLRTTTISQVVEDVVDSLYRQGFRRIVFVTGHGGNEVITGVLSELTLDRPRLALYYVNAWTGMKPLIQQVELEQNLPKSEHASWHEDFPFTRVGAMPKGVASFPKSADFPSFPLNARTARHHLCEGVVSGLFTVDNDEVMQMMYDACVAHLVELLNSLPLAAPMR